MSYLMYISPYQTLYQTLYLTLHQLSDRPDLGQNEPCFTFYQTMSDLVLDHVRPCSRPCQTSYQTMYQTLVNLVLDPVSLERGY